MDDYSMGLGPVFMVIIWVLLGLEIIAVFKFKFKQKSIIHEPTDQIIYSRHVLCRMCFGGREQPCRR